MAADSNRQYIHGYELREQERLIEQALILEPQIYEHVEFPKRLGQERVKLLEVGCGVGAQTALLLRRYPYLEITSVDASEKQIAKAKSRSYGSGEDRVQFTVADAGHMPFASEEFGAAFICFLLEHVSEPERILKETARCLTPGSVIFVTEVFNQLFYIRPMTPTIEKYWNQMNALQMAYGGDPYVGARLRSLLMQNGFGHVQLEFRQQLLDFESREERTRLMSYWLELMLSAAPKLLQENRIVASDVEQLKEDFKIAQAMRDSVFFFGMCQAKAVRLA